MRAQIALMLAERNAAQSGGQRGASGLGLLAMLVALSPLLAACGFMLAQILGYIPR